MTNNKQNQEEHVEILKPKKVPLVRSSRYSVLHHIVHNGYEIPSKEGAMVSGWTPNNVKRIILTSIGAIVQFHMKKLTVYGHTTCYMDYGKGLEQDTQVAAQKGVGGIKPVLDLLRDNARSLSMLEEIILCTKNYNHQVMQRDLEPFLKITNKDTKFKRLTYVTLVNHDAQSMIQELKENHFYSDVLMTQEMQKKEYTKIIYDAKNENWWEGTLLRSNKYTQDKELHAHFESIKKLKLEDERLNLTPEAIEKVIEQLDKTQIVMENILKLSKVYATEYPKIIIYHGLWAYPLKQEEIQLKIKDHLEADKKLYDNTLRLNLPLLREAVKRYGQEGKYKGILDLVENLQVSSLKDKDALDCHKSIITDTLKHLQEFTLFCLDEYIYVGYHGYIGYLSEQVDWLARALWYKLGATAPSGVRFTPKCVEHIEAEMTYKPKGNIRAIIKNLGEVGNHSIDPSMTKEDEIQEAIRLAQVLHQTMEDLSKDYLDKALNFARKEAENHVEETPDIDFDAKLREFSKNPKGPILR